MIKQLKNPIDVSTPLGDATAIMIIDYSLDCNTVWVCRMPGGEVKHFYSDDIRIYDNPMNGKGWDIDKDWFEKLQIDKVFNKKAGDDIVNKLPANAKRNTDFLKKDLPVYYEVGDYVMRTNKKVGDLDDVLEYLRTNLLFKSDKPFIDRVVTIETGTLGLIFLDEFVQQKIIDLTPAYTSAIRKNVISRKTELNFYVEPFGMIEVKYDQGLDELCIDDGRRHKGLPLSSAMLKATEGDKELITFYAVVKEDSCKLTEPKSKDNEYKPLPDCTYIAQSKIHGFGIFAKSNINFNNYIGETHWVDKDNYTKDGFIRTPLGGFINHSRNPNCHLVKSHTEKFYVLWAKRDIKFGEELTIDYSINVCGNIYKHCTWI